EHILQQKALGGTSQICGQHLRIIESIFYVEQKENHLQTVGISIVHGIIFTPNLQFNAAIWQGTGTSLIGVISLILDPLGTGYNHM
ncbi:hypothetical protein ACJX0J_028151, partial [Zea mays]